MSIKTGLALVLGLSFVATAADARDDRLRLPLAAVLASPDAKTTLDPGIHLYFGKQPYAAPAQRMGVFSTNKKTNFFNKTDEQGSQSSLSASTSSDSSANTPRVAISSLDLKSARMATPRSVSLMT